MKLAIRNSVFETNSSAVHSIVIMTLENGKKWENGLYYYDENGDYRFKKLDENLRPVAGKLYAEEEVLNFLKLIGEDYNEEEWNDIDEYHVYELSNVELFVRECDAGFYTYNMWRDNEYLKYDEETYTTPKGETIITYCKYGEDR